MVKTSVNLNRFRISTKKAAEPQPIIWYFFFVSPSKLYNRVLLEKVYTHTLIHNIKHEPNRSEKTESWTGNVMFENVMIHWFSHSWIRKSVTIEHFQLQNQPGHCTTCPSACLPFAYIMYMNLQTMVTFFLLFFFAQQRPHLKKLSSKYGCRNRCTPKVNKFFCAISMRNCHCHFNFFHRFWCI